MNDRRFTWAHRMSAPTTASTLYSSRPWGLRTGFTLVELMISIAIVLILMLGINQIFKFSADTVGSGMAISGVMRDLRAAKQSLETDMGNLTPFSDAPFLVIYNQSQPAYLNQGDDLGDPNTGINHVPQDYDTAGKHRINQNGHYFWLQANNRIHRMDILQMFLTAKSRRQLGTSTPGPANTATFPLAGSQTSGEMFLWLGHLNLPGNFDPVVPTSATSYTNYTDVGYGFTKTPWHPPGSADFGSPSSRNDNNRYGNQFVLGRVPVLLVPASPVSQSGITTTYAITDTNGNYQWFADVPSVPSNTTPGMYPLCFDSRVNSSYTITANGADPLPKSMTSATVPTGSGTQAILQQNGFADIANTTISNYKASVTPVFAGGTSASMPMLWDNQPTLTQYSPNDVFRYCGKSWLQKSAISGSGMGSPLTLQLETALEAPMFLRGCSQFIVEFAGDFLTQSSAAATLGNTTIVAADGDLDYDVVGTSANRTIRWYGMERSTTGLTDSSGNLVPDVLPLYWYADSGNWAHVNMSVAANYPFRRKFPSSPAQQLIENLDQARSQAGNTTAYPQNANKPTSDPWHDTSTYTCAWGPQTLVGAKIGTTIIPKLAPWLIRITIRVDDPNGRLADGKTIELVYSLPH